MSTPEFWRAFPRDRSAPPGARFSASFVPDPTGRGRFDLPWNLSPVLYMAETPAGRWRPCPSGRRETSHASPIFALVLYLHAGETRAVAAVGREHDNLEAEAELQRRWGHAPAGREETR